MLEKIAVKTLESMIIFTLLKSFYSLGLKVAKIMSPPKPILY